jgi:hypothetical protein
MNFLSNILREEGGFDYKKAIVDSIVILIRDIPDAKESGLLHLCEFIEDCEFTYLSTQVVILVVLCCLLCVLLEFYLLVNCLPLYLRYSTSLELKDQKQWTPANIFGIFTTEYILRMQLSGPVL